ncbi:DUF5700 domain-containing putative Zn-dependent protease [Phenylobacterium sp.]|jgi:hypothetical protein|uniref:DUF5700 domain-containing putative Zn-dependent protease n=1 Tax=Phenylobacterium sp. TaxID=1871053 RepID=UPI002F94CCBF
MIAWIAAAAAAALASPAGAGPLSVRLDASAAEAVLAAVQSPTLTPEAAAKAARLPGNAGLIRKARSYGRPADEADFTSALLSAARGEASSADADYRFAEVRRAAPEIQQVLRGLTDPSRPALREVQARIARFTPARVGGAVDGYLVAGGRAGGFAFGAPAFYLNVAEFRSPALARTILAHELYHGVQQLARTARPPSAAAVACRAAQPGGGDLSRLFDDLLSEGSASYVGDILALPQDDAAALDERRRAARGVALVGRAVTLLQLSSHALATDPQASYAEVYALGFLGDEILYSLGYVMSRAIVAESGESALAELIDQPGAVFVVRYASLRSYGAAGAPALDAATLARARALAACG